MVIVTETTIVLYTCVEYLSHWAGSGHCLCMGPEQDFGPFINITTHMHDHMAPENSCYLLETKVLTTFASLVAYTFYFYLL